MSRPSGLVDRVGDPFFALDTDFRFTYLNDRAEALLERSRSELVGRVMWDEFPETVETQLPDGFYRAMDEQVSVSFEVYHTPLETWFETRAFPSDDGLSVYMRDVTERKARKTELARHAAVVEAVHDGVVTLDRNTRITSVNRAVERVLDVDRADIRDDHVETLLERADVPAARAVEVGQAITAVDVGAAASRTVEVPYVDAEGNRRVGDVRFVPIDHGEATIAAVVRDVTDQREYERVITSLHELTRWLLQTEDPEEICATAVHAGSDLLELPISGVWLLEDEHGYLEPVAGTAGAYDEFGGLPRFYQGEGLVWEVFESGEIERFDDLEAVEELYNPETPIRSEIIAPIGTHGVLMTGSLEPHAFDETDVELLSTLAENTQAALERAERERILRERGRQLERQTERLEAVADVLSTELQQQLAAVADSLAEDRPDDWQFPMADDAAPTLDRAERLVDDVREFARNARTVGPRTAIDLETAISAAATGSQLEAPTVVVECGARLRADPDRFGHLLESIFDDAAVRADDRVTIQVGLLGVDETVSEPRGFFVRDDAAESPPPAGHIPPKRAFARPDSIEGGGDGEGGDDIEDLGDGVEGASGDPGRRRRGEDGPDRERAFRLALVRTIADAHGWSVSIRAGENDGTSVEIRDVTTLEPTA